MPRIESPASNMPVVLNQHHRLLAAYPESGGDGHGLSLTADGHKLEVVVRDDLVVHEVGLGVRQPDDVGDLVPLELVDDG